MRWGGLFSAGLAIASVLVCACGGKVTPDPNENTATVTPSTTKPLDVCSLSDICYTVTIGQVNGDMYEAFDLATPAELPANPIGKTSCTYAYSAPRSDGSSKDSVVVAFACPQPSHDDAIAKLNDAYNAGNPGLADTGDFAVWVPDTKGDNAPDVNGTLLVVSGAASFSVQLESFVASNGSKVDSARRIAGDVIANL